MRTHGKLVLGALSAALILAAAVSTASARRFEFSGGIRIAWPSLRLLEGGSPELDLRCPVTLEGSFHSRSIGKISGALIGYITSARLTRAQCTFGAEATAVMFLNGNEGSVTTLPWHIRYDSFSGTLPRITALRFQLVDIGFLITTLFGFLSCLYRSTAAAPAFARATIGVGGEITEVEADPIAALPRLAGEGSCPARGRFSGRGTVTVLNGTERIIVRLVN